jgi:hypothetical protein
LKRKFLALLLTIGFIGTVFGAFLHAYFSDVERSEGNIFHAGEWPAINATKGFKVPKPDGNGEYMLKLIVENNTGIILAAVPPIFMPRINVTNTYKFNISRLEIIDYLPKDWTWKNVTMLFLYTDGRVYPIVPPRYEVNYNRETRLLNVTIANITSAIGKPMEQGEEIALTFLMWYNLTWHHLPEEYRIQPPTYVNIAKATAWSTEGAKSNVAEASAEIKTQIKLVDRIHDAVEFLENMYNSTIGLCAEAPRVAPNTYWLVSDNLWASKALENHAPEISNAIKSKLTELAETYNLPTDAQGLPISYKHEAVIGDTVPTPFRTTVSYTLYSDDYTLKTDIANGTAVMEDWQEYADLLLCAALSKHWEGKGEEASALFNMAKSMWDGTGINDTATRADGTYATYKLALLLYTSKVLGEEIDFEEELIATIWRMQDQTTGGIITDYYPSGEPVEYADANTETTSITIIALTASA